MFLRTILITGMLVSCATPRMDEDLNRLISFGDAKYGEESAAFEALLESALTNEELPEPDSENGIFEVALGQLAIPPEFRRYFGAPTLTQEQRAYTVDIPVRGNWHGVPLSDILIVQTLESEGGFHLIFDAPRSRVLQAANEAGFSLPATGLAKHDADVMGVTIQIAEYGDKTSLSCFKG